MADEVGALFKVNTIRLLKATGLLVPISLNHTLSLRDWTYCLSTKVKHVIQDHTGSYYMIGFMNVAYV